MHYGARNPAENLRYEADLETLPVVLQDDENALFEVEQFSLGAIAAIKPWNVPIGVADIVASAVLAGCMVVLKPLPFRPLEALM